MTCQGSGYRTREPAQAGLEGAGEGLQQDPPRKRADFPPVSAGVHRQPTGVGCEADLSARS